MTIIYLIYFRVDGADSYEGMMRIMKGLDSNTFNYLYNHRTELNWKNRVLPAGFY